MFPFGNSLENREGIELEGSDQRQINPLAVNVPKWEQNFEGRWKRNGWGMDLL